MTKKLLFQFDTDALPSTFDAVAAYDGGIDHLVQVANVTPTNCKPLVEGAIYTRAPGNKKNTAIFIGGSDLTIGQKVLSSVTQCFFEDFRVSAMLDSSGCNTTAAAAVALVCADCTVKDKRTVVLAGTGPVGQRIGAMLALSGAQVSITSRTLQRAVQACDEMNQRFGTDLQPLAVSSDADVGLAIHGAQMIFATGKSGICLLSETQWRKHQSIEVLADVNTQPPAGIEGVKLADRGRLDHGKKIYGGIGIGSLKLKLHRACVKKLFNANGQVLDAEDILTIAREHLRQEQRAGMSSV